MSILNKIRAYWNFDDQKPQDFKVSQPHFRDVTGRGNDLLIQPDQRPATSSIDFRIGANNHGNQQVDGAMAAWGIWKRKLTTAEKAALAGGETWPFSTTPSLADATAYYLLDESSGAATYVDATGRGNDLTRSGTTTQVAGPAGITHGTQFTPGAYLHISPTADLQAGNIDHTICGWAKLASKTFGDQQIYWGQLDVNVSPAQTADVVYYEGTYDTFNVDLGNGVNTIGNGVAVVPTHPVIGQWYFLLTDYDAVSSVETMALDNGADSEFEHNYWSTDGGIVGNGASFRLQPDFRSTTGGWDTPNVPFLTAPNVPDLQFVDGKDKTFWCWFKADDTTASQIPIAGFYDFATGKINWLFFIGANTLYFYAGDGTTGSAAVPALVAFADTSAWHLAVCWYDSGSNTVNLDLDHGAFTSSVSLGSVTVTPSADPYMVVAANKDGSGFNNQFRGGLDEMGIADGIPTSDDLDQLWNSGLGVSLKFPTARLGLLRLGRARLGAAPVLAQEIVLDFIGSSTTVYDIELDPAPQKITLGAIAASSRVFPLTLTGGNQGLQVFIGGKRTGHVKVATTNFTSQTSGRWTGTLVLLDEDGTWTNPPILPADVTRGCGVTILVSENGKRLFWGFINKIAAARPLSSACIEYTVSVIDMAGLLDRRFLTKTLLAGSEVADAIRYLYAAVMQSEGITINSIPKAIDTLDADLVYNLASVTHILDDLANISGTNWWVDVFGDLQFKAVDDMAAAPFDIVEPTVAHPDLISVWRNLTVNVDMAPYRNSQWVLSNLNLSPNAIPEISETITLPQAKATALGFRLAAVVLRFTPQAITSIKVNGVSQPWQDGNQIINLDKSWWSILNDGPYLYGPDSAQTTPLPPLGLPYPAVISPFPSPGDVLVVKYIPNITNAGLTSGTALGPPTDLQLAGSGIVEAVEQVNDISDPTSLDAIGAALLARKGKVPFIVQYETDEPGLEVGMRQLVDLPKGKIPSTTITITSINRVHVIMQIPSRINEDQTTGFRQTVAGNDGADIDSQMKFLERFYRRSDHPLPITQYEIASFVLAPSGSIAGGVVATNPQIVSRNGHWIDVYAQAGVPPTDQDLYIDVLNNGISIFGSPSRRLIIAAGSFALVKTSVFMLDPAPTFVLVGQSLTIQTEYVQVGPNPARAGSVSVLGRWAV